MTTPPVEQGDVQTRERAWDVMMSLADLTFFFNAVVERNEGRPVPTLTAPLPPPYVHQNSPYVVTQGEIHWWWECVSNIHRVTGALLTACEDLVKEHGDDPRFIALKAALAHAQGQEEYDPGLM